MKDNVYTSSSSVILGDWKKTKAVPYLPKQKVSRKKKLQKTWQQDSIDFFIRNKGKTDKVRKTPEEIRNNWNFYNTYLTDDEIRKHLDPLDVEEGLFEAEAQAFQFYDVLHQPFDTLFGEELKRDADIRAFAINPEILNEKDRGFKADVSKYLAQLAMQNTVDNEEVQAKLKEFDIYRKNNLQTAHEKMANQILDSLKHDSRMNLKYKFNTGFKNLEIVGETVYRVGHIGKELSMHVVDNENFFVFGMGQSGWIQDGYAWLELEYLNPHKIIDEFAEELTDKEIDTLLDSSDLNAPWLVPKRIATVDVEVMTGDGATQKQALPLEYMDDFIPLDGNENDEFDENGNVRVYRIQWLSPRKFGKLKFIDEFGDVQYKFVDEEYPVNTEAGEEIKWFWINELWEGTRIGNSIYKKVRPCPVQMRSLINPSIVRPSYVGYVISNNGRHAPCRVDRLIPYQRNYNIFMNKLVTLWTQNIGKVGVVDTSQIPDDMDPDEWYIWLKRFKLMYKNPFEEGKKGAAKGLLAGHMQQSAPVIDLSLSQEINDTINYLNWIEERINKISAVPESRQGDMSGNEGLGVSQQAIVNSSHQTESDFYIQDTLKAKTFELLIEYAKVVWKDEKFKRSYVLDDLSEYLMDIDGALLSEGEFNVAITNSSKLFETLNNIKQLTHAAMQNNTVNLSDIAKMQLASSASEMIHGLEVAEDKRLEQQQKMEQQRLEADKQAREFAAQQAEVAHQRELEKLDREWKYKLVEANIDANAKMQLHATDTNQNNIEDVIELEKEQIKVEGQVKLQDDKQVHEKEMQQAELESKEKIEKSKAKQSTKTTPTK